MSVLGWIVAGGVGMSGIALAGAVTFLLPEPVRDRVVLPLVAFSAGSLLAGALLHMIPTAIEVGGDVHVVFGWVVLGFGAFLALEQFLHWHHCYTQTEPTHSPLSYLMLVGDSLHNLLGGIAVAGAFLVDVGLGVTTWLVAAAHELPQELGKYGVLLHGGWSRGGALVVNLLSSSTFLVGGLLAYGVSTGVDVAFLVPFAAGNFLYIAASDLVPEVNRHHLLRNNLIHLTAFTAGVALLWAIMLLSGE